MEQNRQGVVGGNILKKLEFKNSEAEICVYFKEEDGEKIMVWVHVDDGAVFSTNEKIKNKFKNELKRLIEIKWEENPDKIVGLRIIKNKKDKIEIDQELLVNQLLDQYKRRVLDQNSTAPIEKLQWNDGEEIKTSKFQSFVGSLAYLANGTRPDLSWAVNQLERFSSKPGEQHWKHLDHLIGYLKKFKNKKLIFRNGKKELKLWVDASFDGDRGISTTGYLIEQGENAIQWGSRRQGTV